MTEKLESVRDRWKTQHRAWMDDREGMLARLSEYLPQPPNAIQTRLLVKAVEGYFFSQQRDELMWTTGDKDLAFSELEALKKLASKLVNTIGELSEYTNSLLMAEVNSLFPPMIEDDPGQLITHTQQSLNHLRGLADNALNKLPIFKRGAKSNYPLDELINSLHGLFCKAQWPVKILNNSEKDSPGGPFFEATFNIAEELGENIHSRPALAKRIERIIKET